MKIKSFVALFLSVTLVVLSLSSAMAFADSNPTKFELNLNESLSDLDTHELSKRIDLQNSKLKININAKDLKATVALSIDGKTVDVLVEDINIQELYCGDEVGYLAHIVGTLENYSESLKEYYGSNTVLDIGIAYTLKGDSFAVSSLGYASEEAVPLVLIYGEYTDNIREIYLTQLSLIEEGQEVNELCEESPMITSSGVDTSIYYAATQPLYASSYEVADLHLYHQLLMNTGNDLTVKAKGVTKSTNARNYVSNVLRPSGNLSYVAIETLKVKIKVTEYNCAFSSEDILPANGANRINIFNTLGGIVGVSIPDGVADIVLSRTTVTGAGEEYVEWEHYKLNGFFNTDGTIYNHIGIPMKADFQYNGPNVNSTQMVLMTGGAEFVYTNWFSDDSMYTGYFNVGNNNVWISSDVDVVAF